MIFKKILIFLAIFLLGCAPVLKKGGLGQGQVVIYLSASGPPVDLAFTLDEIWLEDAYGAKFPVLLKKKEIDALSLIRHQCLLAQGSLSAGFYNRLCLKIKGATLKGHPLSLINQGIFEAPIRLGIFPQGVVSLFLDWQPANSIRDKEQFSPSIQVLKARAGLKRLLLYVSNSGNNYLSVIDRGTHQVIDTITVGRAPKGMALSADKNYLYVANSLSRDISVIEVMTNRVIDTISCRMGTGLTELVVLTVNNRDCIYVTATDSNAILVIDALTKSIIKKIEVGQRPVGIAADPDGRYVYVANSYSNNISIIDTFNNEVVGNIGVGDRPRYVKVSQRYILVSNSGSSTTIVLNRLSLRKSFTIFTPLQPGRIIKGLKGRFYVTGERSDDISIIDPFVNVALRKIRVGHYPSGMALDIDRKLLYVTNFKDDTVSIIDLLREREIGRIAVGNRPYDLALIGTR